MALTRSATQCALKPLFFVPPPRQRTQYVVISVSDRAGSAFVTCFSISANSIAKAPRYAQLQSADASSLPSIAEFNVYGTVCTRPLVPKARKAVQV
jgi:hypothetical protein